MKQVYNERAWISHVSCPSSGIELNTQYTHLPNTPIPYTTQYIPIWGYRGDTPGWTGRGNNSLVPTVYFSGDTDLPPPLSITKYLVSPS